MNELKKPKISENFTIEDIHKIREYSYFRWLEDPEGWRKDLKESSAEMQAEIERIKEARRMASMQ